MRARSLSSSAAFARPFLASGAAIGSTGATIVALDTSYSLSAPGGVQIRHFSAVVYVNGRYHGLYAVTDHVDVDLMAREGLGKGGNLYKAVDHGATFYFVL